MAPGLAAGFTMKRELLLALFCALPALGWQQAETPARTDHPPASEASPRPSERRISRHLARDLEHQRGIVKMLGLGTTQK